MVKPPASTVVLFLLCTLSLAGCSSGSGHQRRLHQQQPAGGDVVFVADGAGNFQAASKDLRQAMPPGSSPVQVVTFEWSHGYLRILADQTDYVYARAQGQYLAEAVWRYHQHCPQARIFLLGHSAGAVVVLAAQEQLPADLVERVVLLSPSVSSFYDLRPALCRVKGSIDVFYSEKDWLWLGVANRLLKTADRQRTVASGRFGFVPLNSTDEPLYRKLYQTPWEPADRQLDHRGGHFDTHQPEYMRCKVVPLFLY